MSTGAQEFVLVPRALIERAEIALHWAYEGGEWAASLPEDVCLAAYKEQNEGLVVRDALRAVLGKKA